MMEVIEIADNVIGRRLTGNKIDKADMERLTREIEDKLTRTDRIRVYVEYEKFGGITPSGLLEDLKLGAKHWKAFERKAVVTDHAWTEKVAAAADRLFPRVKLRRFTTAEREAARAWVRE